MKYSAKLNFVTVQESRDEIEVAGLVEICPEVAYISYSTSANTFIIEATDGKTVITRLGPDGYTMVLEENRPHVLRMTDMAVDVTAKKLNIARGEGELELYAEYALGNDKNVTKLYIKATYGK